MYPQLRGYLIYQKCVEGWFWSTSWKDFKIGPSQSHNIWITGNEHTDTPDGAVFTLPAAKDEIIKELKNQFDAKKGGF